MKKLVSGFVMAMALVCVVCGPAMATPKFVNVQPTCDSGGNVTIPTMPSGATLVNVEIYDDVNGTKPKQLGAVSAFRLEPGQGFNFLWKDSEGTWFQMITPSTTPRGHLTTDCTWIDPKTGNPACKFLFPKK